MKGFLKKIILKMVKHAQISAIIDVYFFVYPYCICFFTC